MEDDSAESVPQHSRSLQTPSLPCFSAGTWDSPRVKFYFTSGCVQLGTETGSMPDLRTRPSFLASQETVSCTLCGTEVASIQEVVQHWHWEMEKQGQNEKTKEQKDIPYAEMRSVVEEGKEDVKQDCVKDSKEDKEMDSNDGLDEIIEQSMDEIFEDVGDLGPSDCVKENLETNCVEKKDNGMNGMDENLKQNRSEKTSVNCDQCDYICKTKNILWEHKHREHYPGNWYAIKSEKIENYPQIEDVHVKLEDIDSTMLENVSVKTE